MTKKLTEISLEDIYDLENELKLPASKIICGYLRKPRGRLNKDTFYGHCSLFDKECVYKIPVDCKQEKEYFQKRREDAIHKTRKKKNFQ